MSFEYTNYKHKHTQREKNEREQRKRVKIDNDEEQTGEKNEKTEESHNSLYVKTNNLSV